jgi:hypothetical protein
MLERLQIEAIRCWIFSKDHLTVEDYVLGTEDLQSVLSSQASNIKGRETRGKWRRNNWKWSNRGVEGRKEVADWGLAIRWD